MKKRMVFDLWDAGSRSNDYYLKKLHLYRGCEYGICLDFDIKNEVYLKISCDEGLELIDVNKYRVYVPERVIGVDII